MDEIRDVLCETFKAIIESTKSHYIKRKKAISQFEITRPSRVEQFDSLEIWKTTKSTKRGFVEKNNALCAAIRITDESMILFKINMLDKETYESSAELAIDVSDPTAIDQAIQWLKDCKIVLNSFEWEEFANGRNEK